MALPVSDGFRGEEWAPLGASWTVQTADDGYFAIRSNCLVGGDINGTTCSARWNADTFDADHYAQATLARLQESGGGAQIGPAVRMTPEHYYALLANYYETELVYVRTPEHPSGPLREVIWSKPAVTQGVVLKLAVEGTTLRAYAGTTELNPGGTPDTRIASGTAGVACRNQGSTGLNDWSANNLTVTPPTDTPPTVAITKPASAVSVDAGTTVVFSATATDAVDGNLSATITWSSSLDGALGTGASVQVDTTGWATGARTITASATNSKSLTGTATRTLTIGAATAPTLIPIGGGATMIVTKDEPTAAGRTVTLSFPDVESDLSGTKPLLSRNGAAGTAATNSLVMVSMASKIYALALAPAEVATEGLITIFVSASKCINRVQVLPGAATNTSGQVQVEVAAYASGKAPPTATEVRTELEKAGSTLATVKSTTDTLATDTSAIKIAAQSVNSRLPLDPASNTAVNTLADDVDAVYLLASRIPAQPATEATAAAAKTAAETAATDTAALKTSVAGVKAKTDALPAQPAAKGDAMTLATAERASVAGAVRTELAPELARVDKSISAAESAVITHGDTSWVGGGGGGDSAWSPSQVAQVTADTAAAKAAVQAVDQRLPAQPASEGTLAQVKTTAETVATDTAALKTSVAAVKVKTDNLPTQPAARGDAMTLTSGERTTLEAGTRSALAAHGFTPELMQLLDITCRLSGTSWTIDDKGVLILRTQGGVAKYRVTRSLTGQLNAWDVVTL